jgi:serine/threonine-protein kinase
VLIEPHTQRPILMDFGISKSVREPGAAENTILGTPVNMAPEQILGKEMDNRVDVYGAGVLLFQSLVSNLPLAPHESTRELLKLKLADRMFIRPPSAVNPAVHSDMDEIVVKATAFHPRDRYGSCREFADALKHYAANHLQADR